MFFRTKKIKGKEYAYIVENEWITTAKSVGLDASSRSREHITLRGSDMRGSLRDSHVISRPRKGSRQKVKGYLGRVYRFDLKNNVDFLEFLKIGNIEDCLNNDFKKIIKELIEWELFKHGITKNDFSIDLNNIKIQKNKKNVSFYINDGFMCELTLRNLLGFRVIEEQTDGYRFARCFVEAGIKVPKEVFIGLFGKLYIKE